MFLVGGKKKKAHPLFKKKKKNPTAHNNKILQNSTDQTGVHKPNEACHQNRVDSYGHGGVQQVWGKRPVKQLHLKNEHWFLGRWKKFTSFLTIS